MTLKARLLAVVLVFALTRTLVAAEPVKPTPEQAVAARRMVLRNGSALSVHYRTDALDPLDAVAYQRLEFIENQTNLNTDLQNLARLQTQNNMQAELYHTRRFAAVTPPANGACYSNDPAGVGLQNLAQLEQAYQDVLNIERLRQGLAAVPVPAAAAPAPAPMVVTVVTPAVPMAPAAPAPVAPAPVTPAPPQTPVALAPAAPVDPARMVADMMTAARLINARGPVATAPATPAAPQIHVTAATPAAPAPTPATLTPVMAFGGMATALRGLLALGSLALLFMVR